MILELDAGNTRVKWRIVSIGSGALIKKSEGYVFANSSISALFLELEGQVGQEVLKNIQRVKVSNVRGEQFEAELAVWLEKKWQLLPEFARVVKECGGVRNSYSDVTSMGVDRWLAMLAAYKDAKGLCCIIDCGSAITLDLVSEDGEHIGGYIVPGFELMREALFKKSAVLDSSAKLWDSTAPANDTGSAVRNGLLCMVLGMIEQVFDQYRGETSVCCYLTGGDAAIISPLVRQKHKVVPALVMNGLAISLN